MPSTLPTLSAFSTFNKKIFTKHDIKKIQPNKKVYGALHSIAYQF
jgi:hypothetical protein